MKYNKGGSKIRIGIAYEQKNYKEGEI